MRISSLIRKWFQRLTLAACLIGAAWTGAPAAQKTAGKPEAALEAPEAADDDAAPAAKEAAAAAVAARVGDEEIGLEEHRREVRAALEAQLFPGLPLPTLEAEVLQRMVDQRLVLQHCREQDINADDAEIKSAVEQFKGVLAQQRISLADFLKLRGWDEAELRKMIVSSLTTAKFAQTKLTAAMIESHFQEHQEDFDGTQIRVSHIVLRPLAQQDARATEQMRARAARLRELIDGKRISFADAARKYSAGPSRHQGGDLGIIARRGTLVDAFTEAAFALQDGETSQPVVTSFGVHLIQRLETQPGKIPLTQAHQQVAESLAKKLLQETADAQRAKTKVEFTGATVYRDPKTGELVLPGTEKP